MEEAHLTIGMKAPDFTADTTNGPIRFSEYAGKWVVFFSHPGDFTPVCTTEFVSFAQNYDKFTRQNTQLLGLSVDSNPSHLAWLYSIYLAVGVQIPFPTVADQMGRVAMLYGMFAPSDSTTVTVRNVFIIDPNQVIRAILIYPNTNGRSIPEILRLLTALQTTDKEHVITPANWEPGDPTMVPPPNTYADLLQRQTHSFDKGLSCNAWYWCYNTPQNAQNPLPGSSNHTSVPGNGQQAPQNNHTS